MLFSQLLLNKHGGYVMNIEIQKRRNDIRKAMRHWLKTEHWDLAATFTFADEVSQPTAQKIIKKYWVIVDNRLYGNEVQRRKRRCNRINIVEGGKYGTRIHIHSAIQRPDDMFQNNNEFCHFLTELWQEHFGRHFKIQISSLYAADGWTRYITKNVGRADCDTVDVYSSHIAAKHSLNTLSQ